MSSFFVIGRVPRWSFSIWIKFDLTPCNSEQSYIKMGSVIWALAAKRSFQVESVQICREFTMICNTVRECSLSLLFLKLKSFLPLKGRSSFLWGHFRLNLAKVDPTSEWFVSGQCFSKWNAENGCNFYFIRRFFDKKDSPFIAVQTNMSPNPPESLWIAIFFRCLRTCSAKFECLL